jgi:hypothetical protein
MCRCHSGELESRWTGMCVSVGLVPPARPSSACPQALVSCPSLLLRSGIDGHDCMQGKIACTRCVCVFLAPHCTRQRTILRRTRTSALAHRHTPQALPSSTLCHRGWQVLRGRRPELPLPPPDLPRVAQIDACPMEPHAASASAPAPATSGVSASLATAPPQLLALIRACWQQRDVRRPAAADVHAALWALLEEVLAAGRGELATATAGSSMRAQL